MADETSSAVCSAASVCLQDARNTGAGGAGAGGAAATGNVNGGTETGSVGGSGFGGDGVRNTRNLLTDERSARGTRQVGWLWRHHLDTSLCLQSLPASVCASFTQMHAWQWCISTDSPGADALPALFVVQL